MLKITIACLETDRQSAVEQLQKLGTVHVAPLHQNVSAAMETLKRRIDLLSSTLVCMENEIGKETDTHPSSKEEFPGNPSQMLDQAAACLEQLKQDREELAKIKNAQELLAPWGSFQAQQIADLQKQGLQLYLCVLPKNRYENHLYGDAQQIVSEQGDNVFFAVFSTSSLEESQLPLAPLPNCTDLAAWQQKKSQTEQDMSTARNKLIRIFAKRDMFKDYAVQLERELNFAAARDGMEANGQLAFLAGYIPQDRLVSLRKAAAENAWALRYEEVQEDDEDAPTNLKIPRLFQMAKVIFDFVGILPGYHETDVSICVMVFLSIFCAMLVGDAAYGVLFALLSVFGWCKSKTADARRGCQLLTIMSLCIIFYGSLTGTWFGIDRQFLPPPMQGIEWFTSQEKGDTNLQLLCFFLGATQMSLACAWRALLSLKSISFKDNAGAFIGKIRGAIGQVGWGMFLWANFGLAQLLIIDGKGLEELPSAYCTLLLTGFIIILICGIDWTNMGDVIYMPFTFINCFVDVLSYIRLFAVGLSSMYIAQCFNSMAMSVWHIAPWCIPFAILVMGLGHILNIALACMGVLVHGIRLNTLEFSGHMNISWAGKPYRPLK